MDLAGLERHWCPEPNTGCWLWFSSTNSGGYAQREINGRATLVHRAMYEATRGPIPDGLHIDHLCRVRRCVNPWHLEPVTPKVNTLRGVSFSSVNAKKTHCKRGHSLTDPENTYVWRGGRACRACARERPRSPVRSNGYRKSTCIRGHDYSQVYVDPTGVRVCKECRRDRERERYRSRKLRAPAGQVVAA